MVKNTFQDCHALINGMADTLEEYSVDVSKVALLTLLRDVLVREATSQAMLNERADQVAEFIRQGDDIADGGTHHG